MLIEDINPFLFQFGPISVRWYGVAMALAFAAGSYFLIKNGRREGFSEDELAAVILAAIIAGIAGARALFVLTNWPLYSANPAEIVRIDHGGLAFHGGLAGGILGGWIMVRRYRLSFPRILDLAVPGIAVGIVLVRIANIFNQEILGRPAALFPFERHPTQIYGSLIGVVLLMLYFWPARSRRLLPGGLFWAFVLQYTLLRGLIEETFRDNPLVLWGHVNEFWGAGFFTAVHVATPFAAALDWLMLRRDTKVSGTD